MLLIVRKKYGLYKIYKLDIWNILFTNLTSVDSDESDRIKNKFIRYFYQLHASYKAYLESLNDRYVYRTDIKKIQVYRRFYNKIFLEMRLHKLFYVTIDYHQFYKMRALAAKKDGLYEEHACLALEGRIISCMYRTNFFTTIFESMSNLLKNIIWFDYKVVTHYNFVLTVGKFFGLYYNIGLEMREELGIRCSKGGFIFSIPRYMLVNYKLSYAFMYRYPLIADITFPFDFNLHRVLGYSLS